MVLPYPNPDAHLDDYLERVRLLLGRHVARHWHRMVEASGRLSNLWVSLQEAQRGLQGLPAAPPQGSGLPDLATWEAQLEAHEAQMLERLAASADSGLRFPIEDLRALLDLPPWALDLVVATLAFQIDVNLHRLATFAWADFALKRPSPRFLAELVAGDARPRWRGALEALEPHQPLRLLGVLEIAAPAGREGEVSFGDQGVRVPDRVAAALLHRRAPAEDAPAGDGHEGLDLYTRWRVAPQRLEALGQPDGLQRQLQLAARRGGGRATVVLTGPAGLEYGRIVKACLLEEALVLEIDLEAAALGEDDRAGCLQRGLREAWLHQATPVVEIGALLDSAAHAPGLLRTLQRLRPILPGLLVITARRLHGPLCEALGAPAELPVGIPTPERRAAIWQEALGARAPEGEEGAAALEALAHQYALGAVDIRGAAGAALLAAEVRAAGPRRAAPSVLPADLRIAVRQRLEHKLGTLAEPFATTLRWEDLVLPEELLVRLREIVSSGVHTRTVHERWGFGRLNPYGRALTVLFDGPPGTGKTAAAAIIAREMGAELYRVDLSSIVDKYIGETEKNLARIFDEAERSKAVLLFDEADSLFGKRTAVQSSNDRYANLEVNYLLQRIEHFDGACILTSNFGEGIDEAFMRRIRFRLTFRLPDAAGRELLWRRMIPPEAPLAEEIPWGKLAREFEMAPGHIKNAVLRAALWAAQESDIITYARLRDAARTEYRELGNLVREG